MIKYVKHGQTRNYGKGWFVTFLTNNRAIVFCFRPLTWKLGKVKVYPRPNVHRYYFGPFEVEWQPLKGNT